MIKSQLQCNDRVAISFLEMALPRLPFMPSMPPQVPQRSVVYASDVRVVTGRNPRTARHLLQQIRTKLGKEKHQFITVQEFVDYTGINEELVRGSMLG